MANDARSEDDFLRDVQAFVAEKWQAHHPCDRCGTFQWSILPGSAAVLSVNAYGRQILDREITGGRRAPPSRYENEVEFIPVYCDNCGNTINIYIEVFKDWLKNRRTT